MASLSRRYIFRFGLWSAIFLVAIWFVLAGVALTGQVAYETDFFEPHYHLSPLTPAERAFWVSDGQGQYYELRGEPVYFSLRTLRRFDQARLTLVLEDLDSASVVEAGVLYDQTIWRYDMRPLVNSDLDKLSRLWEAKQSGDILFLQKERKYQSFEDFLSALPGRAETAVYYYDLPESFTPAITYNPCQETVSVPWPIRGAFQIYAYINNEDLDFSFSGRDLNENQDTDDIRLIVYYQQAVIQDKILADAGLDGQSGSVRSWTEQLLLAGLPAGVYKIEIKANDDIITDRMATKQKLFSFDRRLRIAGAEDIRLFTDSARVAAVTSNPASLGTIKVGDNILELSETYRQFEALTGTATAEISFPRGDIILSGDGVFSLSADQLVNPRWRRLGRDLDLSEIRYIIAHYQTPPVREGRTRAQAVFDLRGAYRENGEYGFIISLPGFKETDRPIRLRSLKVELTGRDWRVWLADLFR